MAPSPHLSNVQMPSVSNLVFYRPACLAAPLNAEVLADLEATSRDIAYTISKGQKVPDGWGVVHLVRHMDLLARRPCVPEALSPQKMAAKRRGGGGGGFESYPLGHLHLHSHNHYADKYGRSLDTIQVKPGYLASWL